VGVGYRLGVDLGTTFTAAAVERDGRVEIVSLGSHAASIPSLVFFRADDDVLTGDAAERRGVQDPARLARAFKRRFGDPTPILLDRTPVSADRLTTMMLRQVVADITTRQGGSPDGVGVAHPANWGQFKIDLLRQAVDSAGLANAAFVSEPVAAAVQYASGERVDVGDVIAVYDLGGGTFDAAVLRKTVTGFDTLGQPQGIERLGGIDFDEAVFAHVRNTIGEAMSELDTSDPTTRSAIARLREECILAKEALSSDSEATIPVMLPNLQTQVRITRSEFEDMIRPTLRETIETLRRAITVAGVEVAGVKAVLLAGGSSRIPLISELVRSELGRPVVTDAHPKHAVAMGAARVATQAMAAAEPVPPVVVPVPIPPAEAVPPAPVVVPEPATLPVVPVAAAAAVAAAPMRTIAPPPARLPAEPKGSGKKKFVVIGVAALLVAGGGAVWAMTQSKSSGSAATQTTIKPAVTKSASTEPATTAIPKSGPTTTAISAATTTQVLATEVTTTLAPMVPPTIDNGNQHAWNLSVTDFKGGAWFGWDQIPLTFGISQGILSGGPGFDTVSGLSNTTSNTDGREISFGGDALLKVELLDDSGNSAGLIYLSGVLTQGVGCCPGVDVFPEIKGNFGFDPTATDGLFDMVMKPDNAASPSATAGSSVSCGPLVPNETLPLEPCQKGDAIKRVQAALAALGYSVVVDGQYGPATADAVQAFQVRAGLQPASGVVDQATWTTLGLS
jgi:molecular chaperone DnaK